MACLLARAAVQLGERHEALRQPADDRECHRKTERAGAQRRLRRAADGNPDRKGLLQRSRVDAPVVDRGPMAARPTYLLGPAQCQQEPELLLEESVVIAQVVPEQRE
jgi:hypothetical protein